jgi:O-antigen ligase
MALLAGPLFAFGGVYLWAAIPFVLGGALFAVLCPPTLGAPAETRSLDRWLVVLLGCLAAQLVPLPNVIVAAVSETPTLLAVLKLDYHAEAVSGVRPAVAVSIDPRSTVWAASIAAAAVLVFLSARRLFAGGGLRATVRAIAWMGLIIASIALLQQAATTGRLIYWWWTPIDEGADPFGPFVNRNHFGTYVIMAIPTTFGYLIARLEANRSATGAIRSLSGIVRVFDRRAALLLLSGAMMTVAAIVSLSRSALVGLGVALVLVWGLARRELDRQRRRWLTAYVVVVALALLAWTNIEAILDRFDQTVTGLSGRLEIWRETLPIIRDFWLTGTGAGTYPLAMRVYQEADRAVSFNQAHNHYLQVIAEGGLLLMVPTLLALIAFARLARTRIANEPHAVYWIRVGALGGLVAVAVQSLWETGLRMPANAVLAAVLAAIVVHTPRQR